MDSAVAIFAALFLSCSSVASYLVLRNFEHGTDAELTGETHHSYFHWGNDKSLDLRDHSISHLESNDSRRPSPYGIQCSDCSYDYAHHRSPNPTEAKGQ